MSVTIGVLAETAPGETRVALIPEVASRLKSQGATLVMQSGAGVSAHFPDSAYKDVEFAQPADILARSDVLLKVQPPTLDEVAALRAGAVVVGYMQAYARADLVRALRDRRLTSFSMELIPRISRAQSMDALSSQAAVAGYKAVLIAASTLEKFMPMLTTAAGTIRPATVLVIGAGVAGLQAIATAKRLGAVVEAYDVRSATRDQVKSLGAKFVDTGVSADGAGGYARELTEEEKARQQAVLDARIAASDVVITTAAVPGRAAPRIVGEAAVARMKPGSVIVDIAAEQGGNCALTRAGETVVHGGVKIVGPVNLPATLPFHASEMYSRNLLNLLKPALANGELKIDWTDEVFAGAVLTHDGQIKHEATRKLVEGQ
ncbi:MAG: NAD(P) transhydrogenase subunit alpha [Gammaproteobacteria bacterium]|nr:NAD(P) transhydrogenase subunit alpha [Gammaproteobacteria bacterium]MDE2304655.1 NAD(P) transhydrogenase subunit alpha [Gammaproteobacteria bacterium]